MNRFSDHFSSLAGGYARYRPGYPASLFAWLVGLAPARRRAWDCATGSGQAALALGRYFDRVVATEASFDQLSQVQRRAERAGICSCEPGDSASQGNQGNQKDGRGRLVPPGRAGGAASPSTRRH